MFILIFLIFCLSSCSITPPIEHFYGQAMTIAYHIQVKGKYRLDERKKIQQIIDECFQVINEHLNHYNNESLLHKLNSAHVSNITIRSKHLMDMFTLSKQVYYLSKGKFDPSLMPAIYEWKKALNKSQVVHENQIKHMKSFCGFDKVHLENSLLTKPKDMIFDFDAIAKGYLVDLLCEKLQNFGVTDALVEWGGEFKAFGNKAWKIAILNPYESKPFDIVYLKNSALATSGDYEQFWSVNGKAYSHIIDEKTLMPIMHTSHITSVSIKANSCAIADGLATACMLYDDEIKLSTWLNSCQKELGDMRYWIVTRRSGI